MSGADFEVNVPPTVLGSDLRHLTVAEKDVARRMGLTEGQYRRSKADLLLGDERRRTRGRDLGEAVSRILKDLGEEHGVRSVTWSGDSLIWRVEIETPSGDKNVALNWDLVDDVLDARTPSELQRLKNMVYFALGRKDLIFGARP
jgi:hypothetical protein